MVTVTLGRVGVTDVKLARTETSALTVMVHVGPVTPGWEASLDWGYRTTIIKQ
jgi:hypothetical protein